MIYALPEMSFITITGTDAAKFLQSQLTCDINQLTETSFLIGAYCSLQGRVQATFRIFKLKESYYLFLPREIIPIIIPQLQKYAIFSKVTIHDSSETIKVLGLVGPEIISLLLKANYILPTLNNEVSYSNQCWFAKLPDQNPRYLMISQNTNIEDIQKRFYQALDNKKEWDSYDIAQGFPMIYQKIMDQFTPHALNFNQLGGISFNKGCYLGQEIIARMHYRGHSKQYLQYAIIKQKEKPLIGEKVVDAEGAELGIIINSAKIDDQQYTLLLVLHEKAKSIEALYIGKTLLLFKDFDIH